MQPVYAFRLKYCFRYTHTILRRIFVKQVKTNKKTYWLVLPHTFYLIIYLRKQLNKMYELSQYGYKRYKTAWYRQT